MNYFSKIRILFPKILKMSLAIDKTFFLKQFKLASKNIFFYKPRILCWFCFEFCHWGFFPNNSEETIYYFLTQNIFLVKYGSNNFLKRLGYIFPNQKICDAWKFSHFWSKSQYSMVWCIHASYHASELSPSYRAECNAVLQVMPCLPPYWLT